MAVCGGVPRASEGQQPDVFGPGVRIGEGPQRPRIAERIAAFVHELQGVLDLCLQIANIESEETAFRIRLPAYRQQMFKAARIPAIIGTG
jgi:hypothetical protein